MNPNLDAFLTMISTSEGADYATCFGRKFTITDFSDHPAIIGPWHGEPLDFLGPRYKGLISTAAGRYQITRPTWQHLQSVLHLPNFGPGSQDAGATQLILERGALDLVNQGNIWGAIERCAPEWASLAGSTSGQPQHPVTALVSWYTGAGGVLA